MTAMPEADMSDLAIASRAVLKPISEIAASAGIPEDAVEAYGRYKAKIDPARLRARGAKLGKVVLVSGVSPTPAGEGKSTITVGLGDALAAAGAKTMIALREPSLGPIFGMKGGATGGGYSQVLPMDEINMHFTGDFHAITSANNLLMALLDNHLHQGNALGIDPRRITFKRVMDMNDRALRNIVIGLGGPTEGVPRETGFEITVASEVMAVFCLATGLDDLRTRLGRMTIGYTYAKTPVTVDDLGASGAMTMLLKDAIKPNLVQTMAGTPAFIHGGPFANIAHGCNSAIATNTARSLADIVVTEAGFGADLGAEKFMDIKARYAGCNPDAVVLVATIRALKMHGGVAKDALKSENVEAVRDGMANLVRHAQNVRKFGVQPVIGINRFTADTEEEIAVVTEWAAANGIECAVADVWGQGEKGPVSWPPPCCGPSRPRTILPLSTTWIVPSRRRSRRSCGRSTEAPESSIPRLPRGCSSKSMTTAGTISRCAWPRPSTRSPTTPRCWALPRGSRCTCGISFPRPVPGSSWRSPGPS